MATTTVGIAAGGSEDYTTMTLAEAAGTAGRNSDADIFVAEIRDNSNYDESVVINTGGAPSSTSYFRFTVASANRITSPAYDGTKARMSYSGGAAANLFVQDDYAMIDHLQVIRTGSSIGNNHGAIRIDQENIAIDACIVAYHGDQTGESNIDGVRTQSSVADNLSLVMANCIIYGWSRAGIYLNHDAAGSLTDTLELHHNTVTWCGDDADAQSGNFGSFTNETSNVESNNCSYVGRDGSGDEITEDGSGTMTFTGDYNATTNLAAIDGGLTNSMANPVYCTDGAATGPQTGTYALFANYDNDATASAMDCSLYDSGSNALKGAGVAQSCSDSRIDLSKDIAGNTRPTSGAVDIGAHQLSAASSGIVPQMMAMHG